MIVRFSRFLVLVCLIASTSVTSAQADLTAFVRQYESSLVIIRTYNQAGLELGVGSGFFISGDGNFITNQHVLDKAAKAIVETVDGRQFSFDQIIAQHPDVDLVKATIKNKGENFPYLRISKLMPEKGERIIVFGNPLGLRFNVSDGLVSSIQTFVKVSQPDTPRTYLQFTAPVSAGSSGGPLLNDKGEVVGITTFLLQGQATQNLNFAIPATQIEMLVATNDIPSFKQAQKVSSIAAFTSYGEKIVKELKDMNRADKAIESYTNKVYSSNRYNVISIDKARSSYDSYSKLSNIRNATPVFSVPALEVLQEWGRKAQFDYILVINVELESVKRVNKGYGAEADITMEIRMLDVENGKFIYSKTVPIQGYSSAPSIFSFASIDAAIVEAVNMGLENVLGKDL